MFVFIRSHTLLQSTGYALAVQFKIIFPHFKNYQPVLYYIKL
jgi:hypothetical protein